ncbi:glycerol-3-phosphate dehydrogenase/oxidase [Wenxinia marina]|uniref:Glycerol-3-phosphate dehydrogenase n=1 Tax=Wenxinia marina DSM 24838 TaxID=1123501 RepID=A0A0D0NP08_9RHOB|nr:glycerol-3-phosphate dehydrogenase/oxidase [Wenxinia marina]KIQ70025.1 Glycerol-3-phosphate dehydrogenase [Wenxinia marina DSM 24838]GGL62931.1 glycerol-3-phosphate dehydrogenase [Wenxinia marina]
MSAERDRFDAVIVGAGVNGAGLFRDLCAQGLRCLIVEKADFGAGTSSAPSRMIHGGLKYLETGEFGLVAQSTLERNLLLRNAPHTVTPLQTVIPIFSWTKGVGAALKTLFGAKGAARSRGALLIEAGLTIYDLLGLRARVMPRHRLRGRARSLRTLPSLTDRIVASAAYWDARVRAPERMVWELVADGLSLSPSSEALTRTSVAGIEDGALVLEGEDGRRLVRTSFVANAAGPWIDRVNAALGAPSKLIGGTKGSHLLLDMPDLVAELDGRMIYFEADDGRILLVYPHLGRILAGTTDIPAGDPDGVRCEEDEVAYILTRLKALMPGREFGRERIVYAYSGIRPLPASDAKVPGLISRDHSAPVVEPAEGRPFAIVSLVGGKWTTFRGFAEEVADLALKRLGKVRRRTTRDLPVGGGRDFPREAAARARWIATAARTSGLPEARVDELLTRYGTVAKAIAREGASPSLPDRIDHSEAEIAWIARHEHVRHLSDIVLRRTTLAMGGPLSRRDLVRMAEIAGGVLGWDADRQAAEVAELAERLEGPQRMPLGR